ncbi:MEKHLA domain-containing protein [Rhizobium johnstonii]|jgi:hypothetical protein|uniref:MEKHLA domain-containing protein n=1 Tax=Rhizobium TaxID=379 RepID=UPI003D7C23D0
MNIDNYADRSRLLRSSDRKLSTACLSNTYATGTESAGWLCREALFVVVAHNKDPDPRFLYGNLAAQEVR